MNNLLVGHGNNATAIPANMTSPFLQMPYVPQFKPRALVSSLSSGGYGYRNNFIPFTNLGSPLNAKSQDDKSFSSLSFLPNSSLPIRSPVNKGSTAVVDLTPNKKPSSITQSKTPNASTNSTQKRPVKIPWDLNGKGVEWLAVQCVYKAGIWDPDLQIKESQREESN